jgi:hypothetical protein
LNSRYHVFLENLSGDYFCYDQSKNEWKPQGNFGLHYSRVEASQQGAMLKGSTDLVKNTQTYKPKQDLNKPVLIISGQFEKEVSIKNRRMQHWLFKGIDKLNFVVDCQNFWDPHPLNMQRSNFDGVNHFFSVMAENDRGV